MRYNVSPQGREYMVNHVRNDVHATPRCPFCVKILKRMGELTIFDGLPKEIGNNTDYYGCEHCRMKMNRCCFIFFKGIIYAYSHRQWEELKLNPSARHYK